MRGKGLFAAALFVALAVLAGCRHDNKKLKMIYSAPKDEVVEVPNDPRFNNPPSAEYRAPRPKSSTNKALIGNNKMSGPGGAFSNPGGRPGGF